MKGWLLFNPMAGRFPSQPLVERAARILEENDWDIRVLRTKGGEDLTKKARRAASRGIDALFVAGGDGSLHLAASGLMGSDTALCVLPAGTANVWAQELGLPSLTWTNWMALETTVNRMLSGAIHTMDLGVCQGIPFLMWTGAGFDAFLVHHLEPRTRLEKNFAFPHYISNLAWYARDWPGMNLQVWTDGQKVTGTFLLALVTNVHLYAGGLAEVSPGARIDDGAMDLWLFAGDSMVEIIQHIFDLATGKHIDSEKTRRIPCQDIRMKSDVDIYLQLDGEPIEPSKNVHITMKPRSLKVMVPSDVPRPLFMDRDQ
jgi:YegS/Rv2252/BmrU family lipid kinase